MSLWIKHPRSKEPDSMLTLSVYAFIVVSIKFAVNGITLNLGDRILDLGTTDATLIGALLAPTLGAYVVRKYKDSPDKKKEN